jgi:2-amino-4-hydroxy-6-hydroxymethyldihydropteridine diphosphokinase
MPGRVRAFLGLGSNLGDRRRYLREAVQSLGPAVTAVSSVYETEPVGGPHGQDRYLNVVVELHTDLTARELLGVCHRLETAAGRVRGERWGPRTLDVDILLYGDERVQEPDLEIPHPRMTRRRFVMAPLAELAPDLVAEDWERHVEGSVRRAANL